MKNIGEMFRKNLSKPQTKRKSKACEIPPIQSTTQHGENPVKK